MLSNKGYEEAVLGCFLKDSTNSMQHHNKLCDHHFTTTTNKTIWSAISYLLNKQQCPDTILVIEQLKDTNKLDDAGGESHIFNLAANQGSSANIKAYIDKLIDKYNREDFIQIIDDLKPIINTCDTAFDASVIAESLMASFKNRVTPKEAIYAMDFEKLSGHQFQQREEILSPWILSQSLNMVYAPRGIGKTFVALEIGIAISSGTKCFHWEAQTPRRVLYIDGEMSGINMQERIKKICDSKDKKPFRKEYFKFLNQDTLPDDIVMPDLATTQGQAMIEPLLRDVDLIIIDNISTLFPSHKENDADSWAPIQTWLLRQRRFGRSVLLVHHAGKNGTARGSSRKEDCLDCVISLKRDKDYSPDQGATFSVSFEKARHLVGKAAEPVKFTLDASSDAPAWSVTRLEEERLNRLKLLLDEGETPENIQDELDISRATYYRLKRLATEQSHVSRP